MFTSMTWLTVIVLSMGGLLALGILASLVILLVKGTLWTVGLTPWLMSWIWSALTGKIADSHGSAHFASPSEIEAAGLLNASGVTLARLRDGRILREPLGQHIGLTAPQRSHKSWGFLMPALRNFDGSCVVTDPRGELFTNCLAARSSMGRGQVYRFDPGADQSIIIDPLDMVRWQTGHEYRDIDRITQTLLRAVPYEKNDFREMAKPWLRGLIVWHRAQGRSLADIRRWIDAPDQTGRLNALAKYPHESVRMAGINMQELTKSNERLFGSVMASLRSALDVFIDPNVAKHTTGPSSLDMADLQSGVLPISLFLCSEFADQDRLGDLMALLIEQLCALWSAQEAKRRNRVLLAMDEAMNLGRLSQLESGMSYLAGCGVTIILVFQNERQVHRVYGEDSPLLDGLATRLFYTPVPTDTVTKEEISTALGLTTRVYATESVSRDAWGFTKAISTSTARNQRPLLLPDEVGRMPDDTCILLTKGHPPVMAYKLDTPPAAIVAMVQHAKPVVKRVALAAAACVVIASVITWGIWPSPRAAPTLRLPGQLTGEGGADGALPHAPDVTHDLTTDTDLLAGIAPGLQPYEYSELFSNEQKIGRFELWRTRTTGHMIMHGLRQEAKSTGPDTVLVRSYDTDTMEPCQADADRENGTSTDELTRWKQLPKGLQVGKPPVGPQWVCVVSDRSDERWYRRQPGAAVNRRFSNMVVP